MLPAPILNLSNLTKDMKMKVKMEDRKNIKDSIRSIDDLGVNQVQKDKILADNSKVLFNLTLE